MDRNRRKPSKSEEIQRKLAEQRSEKTDLSAKDIEAGVDKFIRKSRESLGGTELKPPYRRPVWYETFFNLIQQRSIAKFPLDFIKLNIIPVQSEAYKVQNGLRFLNLIDKNGNPTPELDKLRVTGDAFAQNLSDVIHKSYSDLFSTIVVDRAKPESLVNYMMQRYGYSKPLAEEATALFVYFCSKAKIQVSQELTAFHPKMEKTERSFVESKSKRVARERAIPAQEIRRDMVYDESFATLKYDEFFFAVKKELSAIEFARSQVNSLIDYLINKLRTEKKTTDDFFKSTFGESTTHS